MFAGRRKTFRAAQRPCDSGETVRVPLDVSGGRAYLLPVARRLAPLALLALLGACGGGSTDPDPVPTPGVLEIRDGWTGDVVPGASVTPPAPAAGASIRVTQPGFLPREQFFQPGQPVYLWPQDEGYVRLLVYGPAVGEKLSRWTRGFSVSVPPGYEGLAGPVLAEVSRVTGLAVGLASGAGDVTVTVDPGDSYFVLNGDARAYASLQLRGSSITGARVVFLADRWLGPELLLHELGHVIGLAHTARPDVMAQAPLLGVERFTERETVAIRLMYARRLPGNVAPDREAGAAAMDARERTITIVD